MTTPPFIHVMQHQFRKAMATQQNLPLTEDEPVPLRPDLTLPDNLSMEYLEEIPPEFLGETELPAHADSLTFAELLLSESRVSLDHRLDRNLMNGILDEIQGSITQQSSYLSHGRRRTLELFEQSWTLLPADSKNPWDEPSDERRSIEIIGLTYTQPTKIRA
jgi:hypothetical protein